MQARMLQQAQHAAGGPPRSQSSPPLPHSPTHSVLRLLPSHSRPALEDRQLHSSLVYSEGSVTQVIRKCVCTMHATACHSRPSGPSRQGKLAHARPGRSPAGSPPQTPPQHHTCRQPTKRPPVRRASKAYSPIVKIKPNAERAPACTASPVHCRDARSAWRTPRQVEHMSHVCRESAAFTPASKHCQRDPCSVTRNCPAPAPEQIALPPLAVARPLHPPLHPCTPPLHKGRQSQADRVPAPPRCGQAPRQSMHSACI